MSSIDEVIPERRVARSIHLPRVFGRRLSWRRAFALLALVGLLGGGQWGVRLYLAVRQTTGEGNPLAIAGDLINHGSSSKLQQVVASHSRINIALYGYGGGLHDGAYLTDSIMVLSIQQLAGERVQVSELSIPRDWYVPIDLGNGQGYYGRINEAYSDGETGTPSQPAQFTPDPSKHTGAMLANQTLEHLLGIHIDHWVGVDFTAFKSVVDELGGVDVNVEHTFTDYYYPSGDCNAEDSRCGYKTVHYDAGMQHMTGDQALIFARSRHSPDNNEGTDFARSRRQQLLIAAIKQQAVSVGGIAKAPDVLRSINGHFGTDLTFGDENALYTLLKDVDPATVNRVSVDDSNFLYECGYPDRCAAAWLYTHDNSYASISRFAAATLVDPKALKEGIPVTVVNATGNDGVSARWTQLLKELGLNAVDGGSARTVTTTRVLDQSGARGTHTASWLANYFTPSASPEVVPVTTPPAGTSAPAGITLMLGADEEAAFNHTTAVVPAATDAATFDQPTLPPAPTWAYIPPRRTPTPTRIPPPPTPRPTLAPPPPTPRPTSVPPPTPRPTP